MVHITFNSCQGKYEAFRVGCGGQRNYLKACGEVRQWASGVEAESALKAEGYSVMID